MVDYELDKLLVQVRRIEEHREKGAEKEIRKTYQKLLAELRHYLADEYTRYAEEDRLTYGILQQHGAYARFLEEVEQKINDISPETKRLIRSTVEQTYETTYNGLIDCVKKVAAGTELGSLKACTPDVMRRAVENPISKLTLNDRLEKHRKEIVYDIKQNISVGLMNGDRYSTMAKRISQSVEGNYKKAICIARTETHRVREAGSQDAAMSVDEVLKTGESGMRVMKTWRTMKDERVRPGTKAKAKARKYDHRKMDGIAIPVDEEFILPSGAKTTAPGQSGVAGEDINCRCYVSHGLKKIQESDKIKEIRIPANAAEISGISDAVLKSIQSGIDTAEMEYEIRLKEVLVENLNSRLPDTPYLCRYINDKGKHQAVFVLNSGYDFSDITYIVEEGYKQNYFAGKTLEDHIMHEMAHVMTVQHCTTSKEFNDLCGKIEKYFIPGISGYSDFAQDGFETIAEAFVRMKNGEDVPEEARKLVERYILRWKK